jgi:UPF0755 protein
MSDKTPKDKVDFPDLGDDDFSMPDIGEDDLEKLFEDFGVNQSEGNSGAEGAAGKTAHREDEPEPKSAVRPEPEVQPRPRPGSEPRAVTRPVTEAKPAPKTEVGQQPKVKAEPKSKARMKPKAGPLTAAGAKPQPEPKADNSTPPDEPPENEVVFFPKESPEKRHFLDAVHKREESFRKKNTEKSRKLSESDQDRPIGKNETLIYDSELNDEDDSGQEDKKEERDNYPVRFNQYSRHGLVRGLLYGLFIISVSVILACMAWMFASDVLALNKTDTSAVVTIDAYQPPDGTTQYDSKGRVIQVDADQVADALKNAGIIQYKWLFELYSKFSSADVKIDPGTYDVSTKLDYRALVTAMQTGSESMEITSITFPEGYTEDQIFKLLEDNKVCSSADLYAAAANDDFDYSFLEGLDKGQATRLEGYLFPDTYDFYQGESADTAINRFLKNYQNKITADMITQAGNLGYSMHDIITIASLIEKEAGSDAERGDVASVIYNRLKAGGTLNLDSTINYIKKSSTYQLTADDLKIDSPYNTYLYAGLPAGPICNPGLASIKAALNPNKTDYCHFAIDATTGETHFFTNDADFDAFVQAQKYSTLN